MHNISKKRQKLYETFTFRTFYCRIVVLKGKSNLCPLSFVAFFMDSHYIKLETFIVYTAIRHINYLSISLEALRDILVAASCII